MTIYSSHSQTNNHETISQTLKYTLGMSIYLSFVLGSFLGLFFFIFGSIYVKLLMISIILYQIFFAKKSEDFRKWLINLEACKFFVKGVHLHWEDNEKVTDYDKHMYCFHPHGISSFGMGLNCQKDSYFQNVTCCGSRLAVRSPWGGLPHQLWGNEGVNPSNINRMMKANQSIILVPGGFEEATLTEYKKNKVFIKNRKGFIKYALKYGYKVHPTYSFGETDTYKTISFGKIGLFLNKIKIPGVLFWTKYFFFFPDRNAQVNLVVGKPIELPLIQNPTKEDIDKYHQIYIEKLIDLFNKHKNKFILEKQQQNLEVY